MLSELRKKYPITIVEVDGIKVEITRTLGSGKTLVMLPGAQGTSETFYRQILAWGSARDVVSINYPAGENASEQAKLLLRLLSSIGVEHFDVLGTSYGAYLAQWIVFLSPSSVGRMVLGNGFHDPRPAQTPEKLANLENSSPEKVKIDVIDRLEKSVESELRSSLLDLIGRGQSPQSIRDRMLAVQRATPVPRIIFSENHILLIECDDDPLINPSMRQSIQSHYPGAKHVIVSNGGHYPYINKPDQYNDAVGYFLEI